MKEPEGFETADKTHALRLKRALYGLKQAGREWHKKLHKTLCGMGFTRVRCEHSVWVYNRENDKSRVMVPVFVDDITIAGKDMARIQELISRLKDHFKLRDLGETSYLLGVKVERNREDRSLTLSQHQYILDILDRANMSDCKPISTPLDPSITLSSSMGPACNSDPSGYCLCGWRSIQIQQITWSTTLECADAKSRELFVSYSDASHGGNPDNGR